jgi:hypothetical protein
LSVDAAAKKGTKQQRHRDPQPNRVVLSAGPIAAVRTGHVSTSRRLVEGWGRWPLGLLPCRFIYGDATERSGDDDVKAPLGTWDAKGKVGSALVERVYGWSNGCGWCGGCTVPGEVEANSPYTSTTPIGIGYPFLSSGWFGTSHLPWKPSLPIPAKCYIKNKNTRLLVPLVQCLYSR